MQKKIKSLFLLLLSPVCLLAQQPDYAAAEKYNPANLQKLMGTTQIIPFFLKKSNRFWMIESTAPGLDKGAQSNESGAYVSGNGEDNSRMYYLVDMDRKQKKPLFDQNSIVKQLQQLTGKPVTAKDVNYSADFSEDEKTVHVGYQGVDYNYDYQANKLAKKEVLTIVPATYYTGNASPDKKYLIYAKHHNLYIRNRNQTDTTGYALTTDGAEYNSFSINEKDAYSSSDSETDGVWTADSKSFCILRKDTRKVQTLTVVNSLSAPRPYVNTYKYELPGDKDVAQYTFFVGNAAARTLKKVNLDRWPDQEVSLVRGGVTNKEAFILRNKRSRDEVELCAVDLNTGVLRVVIHEISKPYINEDLFNVSLINNGSHILWWSDRTGWGHYYRYDLNGKLINAVTSGNWTAAKIALTDNVKQCIYLYGYGKEKGINPYYAFVYKVGFDGGKMELLTPENATHSVFISPSKAFLVDNFSRIDLEPQTVVRNTSGKMVKQVLKADLSKLYAYGWKQPEMFKVKAKDGVTDLYGLMWKPYNFDSTKTYPIISQVYPGPQIETVWSEFTVLDRYNNTSLSQTGFVVVVMGHRGGSPYRNVGYYKYGYGNLRDYALEDDKAGLEQLAARHKFIDLGKVGIFGHSGGAMMSTAALCTYPDFYKVAVSSSGNHDNTIYNRTWAETYNGYEKKIDLNQSLAKNLKGHLLLVSGESDENVNPAGTMRMADALIKADKNFDLLILPGQSHTYEEPYKAYFQKRLREYFARYLLQN